MNRATRASAKLPLREKQADKPVKSKTPNQTGNQSKTKNRKNAVPAVPQPVSDKSDNAVKEKSTVKTVRIYFVY